MEFRPCIDIHNGRVKQIVGGSLNDDVGSTGSGSGNSAGNSNSPGSDSKIGSTGGGVVENFVSDKEASEYAVLYREKGLRGGHIILLDPIGTDAYEADLEQARGALAAFPGGMQIGGGIHPENAEEFLDMGASHVIVTSYVFTDGKIRYDRIDEMKYVVGRGHLVLDLSVRLRDGRYYVVTDRWQRFTDEELTPELISALSYHCDEFLIHAVNVEGTGTGIDRELLRMLAAANGNPITYAGGVSTYEDIETIREIGSGRIHYTVGSRLDIFGGDLSFDRCAGEVKG
ncbi:MAG: phosphoribosylformimino-5-aminoimidazole carboxamide ribotide isomerase [Eubacterium sp.]|nr:phosphoribosylformimino-5-aminoimidazole carboxamide ribotide isomerase [Eubacterium sp.]